MHINPLKIFAIYLVAIFFATLNLSGIKIKTIADFLPLFDVMAVYHFAVLKPILPIWFLFVLGLVSDALSGFPLGMTSLVYIILAKLFINFNQKNIKEENFQNIFQQFILFAFLVLLFRVLFLSIYHLKLYNIYPPLIQLAITISFYVVIYKLFDYLSKTLLGREIDS